MAQARLKPFPWASLPRTKPAEVAAARRVRAALSPHLDLGRLASEASSLLRQPVELRLLSIGAGPAPEAPGRLAFELPSGRLWVEGEATLMLHVAGLMLGLGPGWSDPRKPPPPEAAGAWAALLVAVARRCGLAPRLDLSPRSGAPPLPGEVAVLDVAARIGPATFAVRVGVPLASLPPPPLRLDRSTLEALGAVPISLPLVAAQSVAARADLAELTPGAAWLPGEAWTLQRQADTWTGRALLVAGPSEQGAEIELTTLGSGIALVLTRPSAPAPWEPTMPDPTSPDAPEADLADALAESPVIMRVEVATVTLEAQQWARLAPGDILPTGVRLGEPVTLRAGGAAFARGELCELDGELAVRILQRL